MKVCENCENQHDGNYGSGRFCSAKCARGFSTKSKRKEINEKISNTIKGSGHGDVEIICENCESKFKTSWNKRYQRACSHSCASKLRWKDKQYKLYMSKIASKNAFKKHKNPDIQFGWKTRKKLEPSYPESIAIKTLDGLNINYEREMPISKYFVDFAIHDMMIILEIDGQQHKNPERAKTDILKDAILTKKGWKVYRIKWPEENIIESIKNIIVG